jgi:hypothetical protein
MHFMTRPLKATATHELGASLPSGTRLFFVPQDGSMPLARRELLAFVPCDEFGQDGLYLLYVGSDFRVVRCRARENGREIETSDATTTTMMSSSRFRELVEGRVVGVGLLHDTGDG